MPTVADRGRRPLQAQGPSGLPGGARGGAVGKDPTAPAAADGRQGDQGAPSVGLASGANARAAQAAA
eukprot:8482060-Lingulodinium_polyedra.AAC.1